MRSSRIESLPNISDKQELPKPACLRETRKQPMIETAPTPEASPTPARPPQQKPRSRNRLLLTGCAAAALVIFVAEVLRVFVGSNFHDVVPGKCYRSAQPTPAFLENLQRTHGVRSIVNLRDENLDATWYQAEVRAADRLQIRLINAGLCSTEQPPDHDFRRFVQAMRDAPEPILIHCANGNDRTGLASAVYLLLRTDAAPHTARQQLSLRYGHFAIGRTLCLHRILDSYEAWLTETGKEHAPDHFYYWGMNVFRQETVRR